MVVVLPLLPLQQYQKAPETSLLLTHHDTHFGINDSHTPLVIILATERQELTEWKSNESWFGTAGKQKCPSQGEMAWSASIPSEVERAWEDSLALEHHHLLQ